MIKFPLLLQHLTPGTLLRNMGKLPHHAHGCHLEIQHELGFTHPLKVPFHVNRHFNHQCALRSLICTFSRLLLSASGLFSQLCSISSYTSGLCSLTPLILLFVQWSLLDVAHMAFNQKSFLTSDNLQYARKTSVLPGIHSSNSTHI